MICGMIKHWTKIAGNKIFVENALMEHQSVANIGGLHNFDQLEYFENQIVDVAHDHNALPFMDRYRDLDSY